MTVITARPWASELVDPDMVRLVPEAVRVVATASPDLPLIAAGLLHRRRKLAGKAEQSPADAPDARPAMSTRRRLIDWASWWLHVPDSRTGWLLPAVAAGIREARRSRPSVVYCTAPGWTSLLAGLGLSRLLRGAAGGRFSGPLVWQLLAKNPVPRARLAG